MPRYNEAEARKAVRVSRSYSEVLRRLGMRPAGGNHSLLRKWVDDIWQISTDHFDADSASIRNLHRKPIPLSEVLIEGSTYSRGNLKPRLFAEGLKEPRCELCGQGELWRERSMPLILDHINGVPDDNRIENLQIVCPNCAATLDTHCGRKNRRQPVRRDCKHCGKQFWIKYRTHRYCSRACGSRWDRSSLRGKPKPASRKTTRPPYGRLLEEIESMGFVAVGCKYGVSDNAVRKWLRFYERQFEREKREAETADEQS